MTPTLLEGPATEPVSLADMKAWLRIDSPDEDELIGQLIAAARHAVEAAADCILISQRWRLSLDRWPNDGIIRLPLRPAIACDAARVFTTAMASETIPPASYMLDRGAEPPRLVMLAPPSAPGRAASGIEIDLRAGFGEDAESIPPPLRLAVRLLAARWFEHRGDEPDAARDAPLPRDVATLLTRFRNVRV